MKEEKGSRELIQYFEDVLTDTDQKNPEIIPPSFTTLVWDNIYVRPLQINEFSLDFDFLTRQGGSDIDTSSATVAVQCASQRVVHDCNGFYILGNHFKLGNY